MLQHSFYTHHTGEVKNLKLILYNDNEDHSNDDDSNKNNDDDDNYTKQYS